MFDNRRACACGENCMHSILYFYVVPSARAYNCDHNIANKQMRWRPHALCSGLNDNGNSQCGSISRPRSGGKIKIISVFSLSSSILSRAPRRVECIPHTTTYKKKRCCMRCAYAVQTNRAYRTSYLTICTLHSMHVPAKLSGTFAHVRSALKFTCMPPPPHNNETHTQHTMGRKFVQPQGKRTPNLHMHTNTHTDKQTHSSRCDYTSRKPQHIKTHFGDTAHDNFAPSFKRRICVVYGKIHVCENIAKTQ